MKIIVLKQLKQTSDGYYILAKAGNKNMTLSGNIPPMPGGTMLEVWIEGNRIVDYSLSLKGRNATVFKNKDINLEEFEKQALLHEKLNHIVKESKGSPILWKDVYACVDNPYEFLPWNIADKVAAGLDFSSTDSRRINKINTIVRDIFRKKRRENYTFTDYMNEVKKIEDNSSLPPVSLPDILTDDFTEKYSLEEYDNKGRICDRELACARKNISKIIEYFSNAAFPICDEEYLEEFLSSRDYLAPEQKDAVRGLCDNAFCIITGGAGVGKTTVLREVINAYLGSGRSKDMVCLVAPTGKAAVRAAQQTGLEACTINKALRKTEDYIHYTKYNPMPYELYLVDECSMIGTLLMNDFLSALPKSAKIYFVGDCNQLEPVECGEPYFDFIKKYPKNTIKLTRNFRQGSDNTIYINGANILNNKPLIAGENFSISYIKADDIENVVRNMASVYEKETNQILAPTNELVNRINGIVLSELYGVDADKKTKTFCKGNKVILLKNTPDFCNGDIGYVTGLDKGGIEVLINSKSVFIHKNNFDEYVSLAYAITTHKAQGSEYENIMIFLPASPSPFISNRLVYTGITRGKKHVTLYLYN